MMMTENTDLILQILPVCPLFLGCSDQEIREFLLHTPHRTRFYYKNEEVLPFGGPVRESAIVLEGSVEIIHSLDDGDYGIVERSVPGSMIGHAFCVTGQINNVSHFFAGENCRLFLFDLKKCLDRRPADDVTMKLLRNFTALLSGINIQLNRKISLLTNRTLRDKLLTYFIQASEASHSRTFRIPFSRDQLARYICSERSSVSRELGRMQQDGLIAVRGKTITLL